MSCLQSSLGLKTFQMAQSENPDVLFNDKEAECLDNCVYKVFATEKVMRAYLPTRLNEVRMTAQDLEKRLNNPNEERGPYFLRKDFEDA